MWVLNRAGKIPFVISGQGHEGAQVGIAFALRKGLDWMVPYYRSVASPDHLRHEPARDHARPVRARRRPVAPAAARCPATTASRTATSCRVSSPVATQLLHATGIAWAAKLRKTGQVDDHLHRRGLVQPGRLPRGPQLRRHPQAAGDLRRREQRLRDLRADGAAVGRAGHRHPRRRLQHARRRSSTASTCSSCYRRARRRSTARAPARARR